MSAASNTSKDSSAIACIATEALLAPRRRASRRARRRARRRGRLARPRAGAASLRRHWRHSARSRAGVLIARSPCSELRGFASPPRAALGLDPSVVRSPLRDVSSPIASAPCKRSSDFRELSMPIVRGVTSAAHLDPGSRVIVDRRAARAGPRSTSATAAVCAIEKPSASSPRDWLRSDVAVRRRPHRRRRRSRARTRPQRDREEHEERRGGTEQQLRAREWSRRRSCLPRDDRHPERSAEVGPREDRERVREWKRRRLRDADDEHVDGSDALQEEREHGTDAGTREDRQDARRRDVPEVRQDLRVADERLDTRLQEVQPVQHEPRTEHGVRDGTPAAGRSRDASTTRRSRPASRPSRASGTGNSAPLSDAPSCAPTSTATAGADREQLRVDQAHRECRGRRRQLGPGARRGHRRRSHEAATRSSRPSSVRSRLPARPRTPVASSARPSTNSARPPSSFASSLR